MHLTPFLSCLVVFAGLLPLPSPKPTDFFAFRVADNNVHLLRYHPERDQPLKLLYDKVILHSEKVPLDADDINYAELSPTSEFLCVSIVSAEQHLMLMRTSDAKILFDNPISVLPIRGFTWWGEHTLVTGQRTGEKDNQAIFDLHIFSDIGGAKPNTALLTGMTTLPWSRFGRDLTQDISEAANTLKANGFYIQVLHGTSNWTNLLCEEDSAALNVQTGAIAAWVEGRHTKDFKADPQFEKPAMVVIRYDEDPRETTLPVIGRPWSVKFYNSWLVVGDYVSEPKYKRNALVQVVPARRLRVFDVSTLRSLGELAADYVVVPIEKSIYE
jgi:hypothetical protein